MTRCRLCSGTGSDPDDFDGIGVGDLVVDRRNGHVIRIWGCNWSRWNGVDETAHRFVQGATHELLDTVEPLDAELVGEARERHALWYGFRITDELDARVRELLAVPGERIFKHCLKEISSLRARYGSEARAPGKAVARLYADLETFSTDWRTRRQRARKLVESSERKDVKLSSSRRRR